MAVADTLQDIFGPAGRLATALPGFSPRPGQLQMAHAVAAAIEHDGALLVEAGTGTGKTLAYLLPALLSGRRVVVSTGTRALQDQIMRDALPLAERLLGGPLPVAYMKGLSNYLCLRRYHVFMDGPASQRGAGATAAGVLQAFRQGTTAGDLSELQLPAGTEAVRAEVCSGSDTRIGSRCKYYDDCFVTRMRKQAERAQLLVVNHHLFFADLALKAGGAAGAPSRGGAYGGVIPDYDAVIFDEAHMLEDIATDFFGRSLSSAGFERLVKDAERTFAACRLGVAGTQVLKLVSLAAAELFATLPRPASGEGGRVPLSPTEFSGRLREPMLRLDDALSALVALCAEQLERPEPLRQLERRAEQAQADLSLVVDGGGQQQVTWTAQRGRSVAIGASPIDLSDTLQDELWLRGQGVVLTSATLTTGGKFDFVAQRLGAPEEAETLDLPSPFDYAAQAALYLPADIGDPRARGFFDRACEEIRGLVALTGGGAFVLCTSVRAMRALHRALADALQQPVLLQGQAPSASLVEQFRVAGNAVLFATASFWQGVDVPGDALRLVIIDKLPFDVPSDPLVQARCARVEETGQNAFMKYLVPSAALALKQGFGRLIRGQHDRGIVAILDGRLSAKGYGKVLLRSLPPATRCTTLEQVAAFWATTAAGTESLPGRAAVDAGAPANEVVDGDSG